MVEYTKKSKRKILRDKKKKSLKSLKNKYKKSKKLSGGLMPSQISDFNDDMYTRKFNCRQPFWEASCI